MRELWQDLRFGVRLLLSQRQFTLVAVVILALGVGTPTAVFSVVNAVVLRPLPYGDPQRLVAIASVFRAPGQPDAPASAVTLTEVAAWRPHVTRLSSSVRFKFVGKYRVISRIAAVFSVTSASL